MKQTSPPKLTPSPRKDNKSSAVAQESDNPSAVFISMALDMSWRLALVVLIPILAGVYLDKHYKAHYIYVVIGLILALIGAVSVVYQSYKTANELTSSIQPTNKGKA